MAKTSSVEKNNRAKRLAKKFAGKRARLKAIAQNKALPMEERFAAQLKLAELPRNSAPNRIRNRCEMTGRPRAYYQESEDVASGTARDGQPGFDPRHDQVELVRERADKERNEMSVTDPIGDMLTRIRNAQERGKPKVSFAGVAAARARARSAAARRLHPRLRHAFSREPARPRSKSNSNISMALRSSANCSAYRSRAAGFMPRSQTLPTVYNGLGISILSTPKGVMSDADARAQNVGGEVLCTVF